MYRKYNPKHRLQIIFKLYFQLLLQDNTFYIATKKPIKLLSSKFGYQQLFIEINLAKITLYKLKLVYRYLHLSKLCNYNGKPNRPRPNRT